MATYEVSKKVFLSHTAKDKGFVRRLAKDIQCLGFDVWFDEWELKVGDSIVQRIEEGIEHSRWMIVVLSPAALESEWLLKELRTGLTREIGSRKVFVLPVVCKPLELPSFLREKFYADFTKSYEDGFALVKDRLLDKYRLPSLENWLLVRSPLPEGINNLIQARGDLLKLSNYNIRQYLAYASHDVRHLYTRPQTSRETPIKEESQLWFGKTGRLVLRFENDNVYGDYDWHGVSMAGKIVGKKERQLIRFCWDWSMSSERGRGVFWTTIPNVLFGGWWMDYDDVDEGSILRGESKVPNRWEFANVQGLTIVSRGE